MNKEIENSTNAQLDKNQKLFEDMIRSRAECEILILRLQRDKSDLDIKIKVLEEIIKKQSSVSEGKE